MKKIIFTGGSGKFGKVFKKFKILIKKIFTTHLQKFLMLQIKKNGKIS